MSNDTGIAYVTCDPSRTKYNKVMGINNLLPGERPSNAGIWRVDYASVPASIEKFTVDVQQTNVMSDYHTLGINVDIHPETGEKTLVTVNVPLDGIPSVEFFTLDDNSVHLVHKRTVRDPKMYNPNSIHIIKDVRFRADDGTPSFFFSNDHYFHNRYLKMIENYFFYLSNVGFYNARTGRVEKGVNGLLFANGVTGTDNVLFIAETYRRSVKQYKMATTLDSQGMPHIHLDYVNEAKFNMAVDNLDYNAEKQLLVVAGHPKPLYFLQYIKKKNNDDMVKPPSQVDIWDVVSGETKTLMQDDGALFGTSTAGSLDLTNSKLVVSGLYEEGLLVCDL
ncbi:hypothetical protein CU098_010680 [Rhizopus stolonifer]|uniref:Serum paraoxonase/arylesterase 2 n=2 Tax=Mucorineae TaxID=1344963 RepID=A0A367JXR5_RHIST|nr:hypothetical protein CU098_010680 [Rhizopus stolonifer]